MSEFHPESSILHPRDAALDSNTDEWPEMVLSNVHVHRPGNVDATASLLDAAAHYPLTVTGQLERLPDDLAHLYLQKGKKKRVNIVLDDVRMFSFGQYPDGQVALWAAGKAGWYSLSPSRAYKQVYADMAQAVVTLYFIADAYREPRRSGKGRHATTFASYTAQELFQKYADEVLGNSAEPSDAAEEMYMHKEFLIGSMLAGKEGLAWSKTPIWKHLYGKFPEVYRTVRERMKGIRAPKTQRSQSGSVRQDSADVDSTTSSTTRKRGRPRRGAPADDIELGSSSEDVLEEIDDIKDDVSSSVPTEIPARGPIRRTRQTARAMPSDLPIMDEEAENIATPVKDDDSDDSLPVQAKSGLRLRGSKASKSAKRNAGKGPPKPATALVDNDENDEQPEDSPSSPTLAGKRKLEEAPLKPNRPSKRRNSRVHADEGIDIPTSPSASAESPAASDTLAGAELDLAIRTFRPDPVQEDTWVCALDGCTHKVYAASDPESQKLIREHYALHAYDDDERVKLVKQLQAPSLPVSHLMEKVRLQAKMEGFPGSRVAGTRFPGTVLQKY